MNFINQFIGTPLGYLLSFCYSFFKNYGLAMILFTFLTKAILFPISIWVQKNSIKMVKLQPRINTIAAMFVGNRDKIAEEQLKLYKEENYKPLVGVIPILIQVPFILGLISVVYNPLQHILHLDASVINAFTNLAQKIAGTELGSTAQLKVVELVKNPETLAMFSNLNVGSVDISSAISSIQGLKMEFLGFNLGNSPSIMTMNIYWLFPILSGFSSYLLSFFQNRDNVIQREQGFWGKWGVAVFLVAFSTYFAFVVPAGVGFYWVLSNVFAIAQIYILNAMYNPRKYIDYEALEESKIMLEKSKIIEKQLKPTKEQKTRGKQDYKRFFDESVKKHIVYYSEKSGFYKYFEDQIREILAKSNHDIHYVTSDPSDVIFKNDNERIFKYYIDDNRLVPLFMQIDADVMVMTTPNLGTYHLKRSLIRKDVEYIYTPHDPMSVHMGAAPGAFDNFDTVFCVGKYQVEELRALEKADNLKEKNLVECGYTLLDNLINSYDNLDKGVAENKEERKKILIAPSWQEKNILDLCLDDFLPQLIDTDYDITVRPHPEYVKRYPANIQGIISKYEKDFSDRFRIETDFSSNVTIFTADLVITDWSGIAFEFSYATKKPSLFINTPMKIMNTDYEKINITPMEVSFRDKIGCSLDVDKLMNIDDTVSDLLNSHEEYKTKIQNLLKENIFNVGKSAKVAAEYIIEVSNSQNEQ